MSIVLFLFLIIVIFYLPGRFILRKINYKGVGPISLHVISFTVGFSLFLFIIYLLAWVKLEWIYLLIILYPVYSELKRFKFKAKNFSALVSIESLFVTLGSLAMLYLMALSGRVVDGEMLFYNVNAVDSIYHLSLIGNMIYNFPPTHPGLSGELFRGYNFFYDFYIATFVKLFHFDRFDLFFRYSPLFIALLYGFSGVALAHFLKFSKYATLFFISLLYFSQSGRFLLYFYKGDMWKTYDSRITQSFNNIIDPSVIVSVTLLFCGYILLFSENKKAKLLSSLLFGVLPSLKIYTSILAFGSLFVVALYGFLRDKRFNFILVLFISSVVAIIVYAPINLGVGSLIFQPFLLYKNFMEGNIIFAQYKWGLKYMTFESNNNFIRISILNAIAFLLLHLPSLGIRVMSIFQTRLLLKKAFYTDQNIFWMSAILFSFAIPTFFIQSFEVFVIVQLLWIGYIILLIPTAYTLGTFVGDSTKKVLIIFIFLIAMSLPDIVVKLQDYSKPPFTITNDFLTITMYIEKTLRQGDGIFAFNRIGGIDMYKVPLISALTAHSIYYEPETIEFPSVRNTVDKRRENIELFVKQLEACKDPATINEEFHHFLTKELQHYVITMSNVPCLKNMRGFSVVIKRGDYVIYKVR